MSEEASTPQPSAAQLNAFISDLAAVMNKHGLGLDPGAKSLWNTDAEERSYDLQHSLMVVPAEQDRVVLDLRRASSSELGRRNALAIWNVVKDFSTPQPIFNDPSEVPESGHFYVVRRSTGKKVGDFRFYTSPDDDQAQHPDEAFVFDAITDRFGYRPLHTLGFGDGPDGQANPLVAVDPLTFELEGYVDRPPQLTLSDAALGVSGLAR